MRSRRRHEVFPWIGILLLATCTLVAQTSPIIDYESRFHPVIARNGMVSSQERMASEVGLQVLKEGGNAVDAGIAVAYTLAVTLPKAGNLGGGGFVLVYLAEEGETYAFDFREMAPAAASRDMYLDAEGNVVQDRARFSAQSVGVPGTVQGLSTVHRKFGTLPLSQLIQPAIDLAHDGIEVSVGLAADLLAYEEKLKSSPAAARIFYKANGDPYRTGETLTQTDLAWSLEQIADSGAKAFYEGAIANRLVSFMEEEGGLITHADLENYQVRERTPIVGSYRGFEIVSMPPPSSGGVHLVQMLNILEGFSLREMGHNSAEYIHHLAEAMKPAYADRSLHLGDSDFARVPSAWLTSKEYGKELSSRIQAEQAIASEEIRPGTPVEYESEETTHFSVVDRHGNAVSLTYTLNFSFGSLQMAPGTGILLNNEMDDFSAKPGVANAYGLLGGETNAIAPGKRPLSSMTPTMVMKDGELSLVTGSPGGSKIITTVLQTILNVVEFEMNIAEASSVPRIHHQWMPDELRYESGISPDTLRLLEERGHELRPSTTMGSTQSIRKIGDRWEGYSDPRRPGAATAGY